MVTILLNEVKKTNDLMVRINRRCCDVRIGLRVREKLSGIVKEGLQIIDCMNHSTFIIDAMKTRIQNYYILCYDAILRASMEAPSEYCELQEVLQDFKDQQLLINELIKGNLENKLFI
jgi:hypothetical protein